MLIATKSNGTPICAHCGKALNNQRIVVTDDHFIPKSLGFEESLKAYNCENHVQLCYDCNHAKSDIIVNPSWYQHLKPSQRKQLKVTFDRASVLLCKGDKIEKNMPLIKNYNTILNRAKSLTILLNTK